MIHHQIQRQLDAVARRIRSVRFWSLLALAGLVLLLCGVLFTSAPIGDAEAQRQVAFFLLGLAGLTVIVAIIRSTTSARDVHWVANRVEARYPDLDSRLLSAVEIRLGTPAQPLGYLEESVIKEALVHGYRHPWADAVPISRVWLARIAGVMLWGGFAICVAMLLSGAVDQKTVAGDEQQQATTLAVSTKLISVTPGDTQVEKGTSLIVKATYEGAPPEEAWLVWTGGEEEERRIPLSQSFDDPVYAARISGIEQNGLYRVELGNIVSDTYRVAVFEYPRLERMDVVLEYPSYTGREPKLVQDARRVSAIEGTQVTVKLFLNKSVSDATLVGQELPELEATPVSGESQVHEVSFALTDTLVYQLRLVDDEGRENRDPPELTFNALHNHPATIRILQPSRDVRVSTLEEFDLKAEITDDFSLSRYGIEFTQGVETEEIELGAGDGTIAQAEARHTLYLEELDVEPNDVLTYTFWAEDFDAAGNSRRVYSDMFFADVRPFDEIFREGEPPPGGAQQGQQGQGQQGGGQQTAELLELQKQVINGTWNVIRRESGVRVSEAFADDVDLLRQSQQSAREQFQELAGMAPEEFQETIQSIELAMQTAETRLGQALLNEETGPLEEALQAEREAFAGLMKLRNSEFEVSQGQQQQGQQGGGAGRGAMQQQLQQLQLSNEENRYEQQSTAQENESQAERENRQILNRLRELAQRQEDLNKQLRELQTALQNAETEEEREAIERQLKRLREEQEQILRDTEELQERAENSSNREELTEAREQLDEARNEVAEAAESLRNNEVSEAAASGTRAEQQFEDLRDEFQRRTSGQFDERMQEMTDQAGELQQRQQDLSDALDELSQPENRSLRDDNRQQILDEIDQQRDRLEDLLQNMKDVVQQSEESEPLLSDRLYDAYRDAVQNQTDEALDQTQQLLDQGFLNESRETEQFASDAIDDLAEGVQRAAESVLGDELESLQRAEQTLRDLANELNREIGEFNPDANNQGEPTDNQSSRSQDPRGDAQGEQQEQTDASEPSGQQGQEGRPGEQDSSEPSDENNDQPRGEGQQSQQGQESQQGQPGQQQPGQNPSSEDQQSQGQSSEGQPSQGEQQGQQPGQQSPSEQQGQSQGQGQQPGGQNQQGGQDSQQANNNQQGDPQQQNRRGSEQFNDGGPAGINTLLELGGGGNPRPVTGEEYRDWADRLRDVEEMVRDPELRAEAARIREQMREIRGEFKRHSEAPNWDLVESMVAAPLEQLRQRVSEELLRRQARDARVPLDRDPVPSEFTDDVNRYYERLGTGR